MFVAILTRALNSSHWEPVQTIITLSSGIWSISPETNLIISFGTLIYPSSWQSWTFPTIDLPARKITLLCLTALSIIWISLQIFDANVEITILWVGWLLITRSRFSPINFSLGVCHGVLAFVDSPRYNFTHSCPILEIFPKSAGLSIAGTKSILKSHEWTIFPFGVWIAYHIDSGIEWFTRKGSTKNSQSLIISISGSIILYFIFFWSCSFWLLLINPNANGVV